MEMSIEDIYVHVTTFRGGITKGHNSIKLNHITWGQIKFLYLNEVEIGFQESISHAYERSSGNFDKRSVILRGNKWTTKKQQEIH